MKKDNIYVAIILGVLSAILCRYLGYSTSQLVYWLITLAIIIPGNMLYAELKGK